MQYDDELIIFACQVLEYQPEPSNQWTTVGQLETGRQAHAVLSIGPEALPCLQGCLIQDDLFVDLQLLSSRLSLPLTFSSSSSCLSEDVIICRFYMAKKTIIDKYSNLMIMIISLYVTTTTTTTTTATKATSTTTTEIDQSKEASISQTQKKQKVKQIFLLAL